MQQFKLWPWPRGFWPWPRTRGSGLGLSFGLGLGHKRLASALASRFLALALASALASWPRPWPQTFGLGIGIEVSGLGLEGLALASWVLASLTSLIMCTVKTLYIAKMRPSKTVWATSTRSLTRMIYTYDPFPSLPLCAASSCSCAANNSANSRHFRPKSFR